MNEAFRFVGADGFSDTARELRYKNGLVSGDTDGDGRVDLQIDVANDERLDADDFIL